MLFNFPSFIGEKEQDRSELLYENVRVLISTHIEEIWYDLNFGTTIRNKIKHGIDALVVAEILDEIRDKVNRYFSNDLVIKDVKAEQQTDKLFINLEYLELRTGKHFTVTSEEIIINNDTSLY